MALITLSKLPPLAHNLLLASVLIASASSAQEGPAKSLFINPMDIPLDLSGNFMEPRGDHFHSGLDMRTQGKEGIPVRAVADGWVSRIKISPWGYGKAVYIDHPDGHTSVYGHLQQLKGPVAEACLDAQYRQKDFSIDFTPEKGAIPVKQGEVIALSGNTGGSSGAHLHFELRRTSDQHALDPEALGIDVKDHTPPEMIGVRLYPLTDSSRVCPYPARSKGFATQGGTGRYGLKPGEMPMAYGTIGLALHTIDRYDGMAAKCGPRSIELFVDSQAVFSTAFDVLDFSTTRFCNAHMDHALFKGQKMDYHRCYRQPNDKLKIYGKEEAQGRIVLVPGRQHHVRFKATDANGNVSELVFLLKGATRQEAMAWTNDDAAGSLFRYDTENILAEDGVSLTLPALSLYDDTYVRYERKAPPAKAIVPLHILHDPLTPIHSYCSLHIATPGLKDALRSKALIVRIDGESKVNAVGGTFSNGGMTAQVRAFGAYTVMVDTVPPVITNVDLKADMHGRSVFTLKVADNLSGIGNWKGLIDGSWVLLEYEPKNKTLKHIFDKHTKVPGKKTFSLEVTDDRGNTARYETSFTH
ncbi:MAG: M23 family metallopeptidase [Flavobacteriales bacterium]|nr:M23 family metallopeptidase [Flavobacteriales bacterium]